MNIIEWNIGYSAKPKEIFNVLKNYMDDTFIFMILEVLPNAYNQFVEMMDDTVHIEYSLNYRVPGKYDEKNRKLGVMIITSNDIKVVDAGVFNRTLFPDRTLYERIIYKDVEYKIAALHSITGCSYKTAKSVNFLSFAEMVNDFQPDLVAMDANEPEIDHYEIKNMKFFEKNGKGAKVFFETLNEYGLQDSYALNYDKSLFKEGTPLAVSHIINKRKPVRYDFCFINNKFKPIDVSYKYNEAKDASADHAILLVRI